MNYTIISRIISLLLFVILLTGCMLPDSNFSENQLPNEDQLQLVQSAVENYSEETNGLLPIRTKDNETPIFEKYLIDFDKLQQLNLLTDIPSNAYEKGGFYQYAIISPEENLQVKVIDLRVTDAIRKVNMKLDTYRSKHTYPPYGDKIEDGIFEINYEKLGLEDKPYVTSPFSNENLPLIMDINGHLHIDYRIDLYKALEEFDHNYEEGDDLRYILTDHYPIAPAHSLPYTLREGEPVINVKQ